MACLTHKELAARKIEEPVKIRKTESSAIVKKESVQEFSYLLYNNEIEKGKIEIEIAGNKIPYEVQQYKVKTQNTDLKNFLMTHGYELIKQEVII